MKLASLASKENPLGVNPPESLSKANTWYSFFLFASDAYLIPPLNPFSSFINMTALMVFFG